MDQLSCNFSDENFCDWHHGGGDVLWLLESNIWSTHDVGPLVDHTTGSVDVFFVNIIELNSDLFSMRNGVLIMVMMVVVVVTNTVYKL